VYHQEAPNSLLKAGYSAQRQSLDRSIQALKAEVTIQQYLATHGVEVRRNRARCIVHGGDNPASFQVHSDGRRWRCHACGEWGDVIDLAELVERHADCWTAVVSLAQQFNVELPRKSDRWHDWQEDKARRHKMMRDVVAASYRRRYFRLFNDYIEAIEDPDEREQEARSIWQGLYPLALYCAQRRTQQ